MHSVHLPFIAERLGEELPGGVLAEARAQGRSLGVRAIASWENGCSWGRLGGQRPSGGHELPCFSVGHLTGTDCCVRCVS